MAAATLSIKLRCASWQQLATIYKRDLSRGSMFLKASTPAAARHAGADRSRAAERDRDRADRHDQRARHRSAARHRRRAQARAAADQDRVADRERARRREQGPRADARPAGAPTSPTPMRAPGDSQTADDRGREHRRGRGRSDPRARGRGRVAAQAEPVPRARRRLRDHRRRRSRRVRRADEALSPGSVRALPVDEAAPDRRRDLHPDPRRVSPARRSSRAAQQVRATLGRSRRRAPMPIARPTPPSAMRTPTAAADPDRPDRADSAAAGQAAPDRAEAKIAVRPPPIPTAEVPTKPGPVRRADEPERPDARRSRRPSSRGPASRSRSRSAHVVDRKSGPVRTPAVTTPMPPSQPMPIIADTRRRSAARRRAPVAESSDTSALEALIDEGKLDEALAGVQGAGEEESAGSRRCAPASSSSRA